MFPLIDCRGGLCFETGIKKRAGVDPVKEMVDPAEARPYPYIDSSLPDRVGPAADSVV